MGFDSFGLPAEQYAIETGQHPAETTKKNIATFKSQLDKIGFCYDWEREVQTSDPNYYKWTQKIFLELYNSYFCNTQQKARPIAELVEKYATKGCNHFTAEQWNGFSKAEQEEWLMKRRLAFSSFGEVNWCEALGTVLANDEVVNGVSERGGHPVVKKKMRQWYLRITAYADRLLQGLETVDFSESMKEMQRNWIGRSEGAEVEFAIKGSDKKLKVYTTRPDTIFGVDFMVLAPELDLVNEIKSPEQAAAVEDYMTYVKSRSDRERQADVKQVSGCFTGAYAINPFNGVEIPIWIAEYVLAGYGTGAIMAVPCGDERDFRFAQHFNIPVTNIIGAHFNGKEANPTKEAILENSGFLNGLLMKDAIGVANDKIEAMGIGKRKVNFKMRDAGFSRQRYWGEPFPIIWDKDGVPTALDVNQLPLELPHVEKYGPGPEGEGPLANITDWVNTPEGRRETSTMPGYAGSSWYFLRYMDPNNTAAFVDRKVSDYWNSVDLYIGGTEHAVGHLLYSRMWTKVLYDLGYIGFDEPFKKLLNQGMIQGSSRFIYLIANVVDKTKTPWVLKSVFLSEHLRNKFLSNKNYFDSNILDAFPNSEHSNIEIEYQSGPIPVRIIVQAVDGYAVNISEIKKWRDFFKQAIYVTDKVDFLASGEVEKMSKSKYNTVNPDELCEQYGADTFRMYEMFLGPVEQSKPWDTKGIEGVHRFLKKLWRLFYSDTTYNNGQPVEGKPIWNNDTPTAEELKVLHKTIKKIDEDTERFSYNTAVSAFMVCVNDLADLKCNKKAILEQVLILLTPYAPHIAEELWSTLGNTNSILDAAYPVYNASYTTESSKEYPVSINGKMRTTLTFPIDAVQADVEPVVLANEIVQKWLEGNPPKKIIFVKNKMINVVI
jgi:leucyl-tRNA synthetase